MYFLPYSSAVKLRDRP